MKFGDRVRQNREKAGLSQTGLSKIIGVRQATISQIEAGKSDTTKHIFKLAKALGVQPHDLDPAIPVSSGHLPPDIDDLVNQLRSLTPEDQELVMTNLKSTLALVKKRTKIG